MLSRLTIERYGPAFLAVVVILGTWWRGGYLPVEVAKELLAALLSASAISAGFMTTALSVLLPMGGTAIGQRLKRRGKLGFLFGYLRSAIYSCIALSAVCVIGLFRVDPATGLDKFSTGALVTIAVYAAASFVRILEILIQILPQMAEPEDRQG